VVQQQSRELVALNADVVGYSALIADNFEATTAVMADYRRLVETRVGENNGTLANFVGDSFMAVFDEPMAALRAAIAIATVVEQRNSDRPSSQQVRFRMGMDQGSVAHVDGDYLGDALNIAARIQAIAPAGGLAVSGRVYRALDEPALRFRPTGHHRLKNIPEQTEIYQFADLPSDSTHRAVHRSLELESPTLAILPTHTEMVDDTVRATAGMIRHDLVHRLSMIPGLNVVDAPSEPGDGSAATTHYMVETGVHQFGSNVRVFAVLFDMDTMNVVKSHKWMTTVDEMFQLSERLAEDVANSVTVELVVGEPARLYAELDDPAAIEKVYLGWYHLRNDTQEGWQRALEMFGDVARSHPEHPYGFVLSGFAWWLGAANGWADNNVAFAKAIDLASQGAEAGDQTGMAQAVEAAVMMSRGQVDEALSRLDNLEITRPTCDVTYGLEGSIRRYLGQWEKAVELIDVAMRLTGINKPWYPTVKASSLFAGGRLEEAASLAQGVLEYQPHNLEALLVLAAAEVELGLDRRARATADVIKERFPSVDVQDWLDRTPYQRREVVERWKGDLMSAGAIAGV
jgi:adenylate cyclase